MSLSLCPNSCVSFPLGQHRRSVVNAAVLIGLVLLELALAGCVPQFMPQFGPQFVLPDTGRPCVAAIRENRFIACDGAVLPLRSWRPERGAHAIIIALHGFNDYSNFIAHAAGYFSAHGIAVYAYDQRGFGDAPNRGRWPGRNAFAADLRRFVGLMHKQNPEIPIYLLGHSMGAAVVLETEVQQTEAQQQLPVAGIILAAPAVMGWDTMPIWQQWGLWLAAHTIPGQHFTGESLGVVASDNREMLLALGRDPLVIKETRVDTIYGLVNLMQAGAEAVAGIKTPALILYGEHDQVIPEQALHAALAQSPPRKRSLQDRHLRLQRYRNGYHMLLRDLQAQVVWHDIVTWIGDHASPFASERAGQSRPFQ